MLHQKRGFAVVEFLVVVVVVLIIGLGLVILFGLRSASLLELNSQIERVNTSLNDPVKTTDENIIKDTIVFVRNSGNLVSYDLSTDTETQITSYNGIIDSSYEESQSTPVVKYPLSYVFSPTLINTREVGFGKCDMYDGGVEDKYGNSLYSECGIFKIDLKTRKVSEVLVLKRGIGLQNVVWFDAQTYAYITTTPNWKLFYVKGDKIVKLQEEKIVAYGDEYGVYSNLSFSRKGSYLLQVSPFFPRGDEDDNVYVYNLSNYKETVVKNAWYAEWLNDEGFVYNKYQTEGIWLFEMDLGTSRLLPGTVKNEYQPIPQRGHNVFMYKHGGSKGGNMRVYEGEKGEIGELLGDGCSFYGWVNPETVMCKGLNESPIYNVVTGKLVGSIRSFDFNQFVTEYNGSYAKYESFIYPLAIGTF